MMRRDQGTAKPWIMIRPFPRCDEGPQVGELREIGGEHLVDGSRQC